jgi:uncharacterized protein (DUF2235 family)
MKKIAIFFDGTWNTPNDGGDIEKGANTNVYKLYKSTCKEDEEGTEQLSYYISGVGDKWYNRIRGGVIGVGIDNKIKEGYNKLVQTYDDGDEIFVIGFSRGAYSARSLVGMIRNSGLLYRSKSRQVNAAYELYRTKDESADNAMAINFRNANSRKVKIKAIGVWDTVGTFGIPLQSFGWFNAKRYEFHDCELSGDVENGFHAIAIDEFRNSFSPTLWDPSEKSDQKIVQTWFAGAHADVGGGYLQANLSDITLKWMSEKLGECGLHTDISNIEITDHSIVSDVHDSFSNFLKGGYKLISIPYCRELGNTRLGEEKVALEVERRIKLLTSYSPRNKIGNHLMLSNTPIQGGGKLRDTIARL